VRKARMGELGKVGFAFNPYRQTFEQLAEAVQ
jgi:hypothetical protein